VCVFLLTALGGFPENPVLDIFGQNALLLSCFHFKPWRNRYYYADAILKNARCFGMHIIHVKTYVQKYFLVLQQYANFNVRFMALKFAVTVVCCMRNDKVT